MLAGVDFRPNLMIHPRQVCQYWKEELRNESLFKSYSHQLMVKNFSLLEKAARELNQRYGCMDYWCKNISHGPTLYRAELVVISWITLLNPVLKFILLFVCVFLYIYFKTSEKKTPIDPDKISEEISPSL